MNPIEKDNSLQKILRECGSITVAFSGGVDSSFLLKKAVETLSTENVLAVMAVSSLTPEREVNEAKKICELVGARLEIARIDVLTVDEVVNNVKDRCYYCKKAIFSRIKEISESFGIYTVADGTLAEDSSDYRPGLLALKELKIKSPLKEAEISKEYIRNSLKEWDIPIYNKPSYTCLATRVPYGETITKEKLEIIDKAEQLLFEKGFKQFRVRLHGNNPAYIARIELLKDDIRKFINDESLCEEIYDYYKSIGIAFTSIDIKGYRTGSMNETI